MSAILAFFRGLYFNITAPFRNFTGLQWVSLALGLSSLIMANADIVTSNPWLPGWFVQYWPHVLVLAGVVARYGHIMYPQAPAMTPAQMQKVLQDHLQTPMGQIQVKAAIAAAAIATSQDEPKTP